MCIYEIDKIGTVLLDCLEVVASDGRLWMVGMEPQVVYSADYSFQDIVPEYVISKYEDDSQAEVYHYIRKRGNELFLFPGMGKYLRVINCETGAVQNMDLLCEKWDCEYYYTQDVIEFADVYYIFPADFSNPLLRFDGKGLQECAGWIEAMQKLAGRRSGFVTESVIYDDGKAWVPLHGTNRVVCTILAEMRVECYDIPKDGYFIDIMQKQGDSFWIVPFGMGNHVILWSPEKGIIKEYSDFSLEQRFLEKYAFTKIVCRKDSVWFLPRVADAIVVLDLDADRFEAIELPEDFCRIGAGSFLPKCCAYAVKGSRLILPACGSVQHLIIDMDKKKIISKIDAKLLERDYEKTYRRLQRRYYGAREWFCKALEDSRLLELERNGGQGRAIDSETYGEKIWMRICKT